ncbi:hypothetical protein LIER_12905 [Lithospermum erythrorhizon]|uniref:Uncharacterized protein n=1 Tax=Lithospermum erythrorhizon TaxID=34254 RepID=A0AAV3PTH1_LITER
MPRVDPKISLHKLHLDPSYKPVKLKKRNFSEEKNLAIREEVDESIKAGAIREWQLPEDITKYSWKERIRKKRPLSQSTGYIAGKSCLLV